MARPNFSKETVRLTVLKYPEATVHDLIYYTNLSDVTIRLALKQLMRDYIVNVDRSFRPFTYSVID